MHITLTDYRLYVILGNPKAHDHLSSAHLHLRECHAQRECQTLFLLGRQVLVLFKSLLQDINLVASEGWSAVLPFAGFSV